MRNRPILTLSFVSPCGRRAEGGVTFSGTRDRFSGGCRTAGPSRRTCRTSGLCRQRSRTGCGYLRTPADNGHSLADDAGVGLMSANLADNRLMSANPSHNGRFSADPSDNGPISADPSNTDGALSNIPPGRRPYMRPGGPWHARHANHPFWRLKPPEGSGSGRSGDRAESLRTRPESCLARGQFHGFM